MEERKEEGKKWKKGKRECREEGKKEKRREEGVSFIGSVLFLGKADTLGYVIQRDFLWVWKLQ